MKTTAFSPIALTLMAGLAGCVSAPTASDSAVTVSNYFSFNGRDAAGLVAFSVDFVRIGDGDGGADDVEATLHDEHRGWVAVAGTGYFDRAPAGKAELVGAPSFALLSGASDGLKLASPANDLVLAAAPIKTYVTTVADGSTHAVASVPAELRWEGRILRGRLVHDRYSTRGSSGLRSLVDGGALHGIRRLHLRVGADRDFFAVGQEGDHDHLVGFELTSDANERLQISNMPGQAEASLGGFQWPRAFQMEWQGEKGKASFDLKVLDHRQASTFWLPGARTTGIVSGLLRYGESTLPIYGLADLHY